LRELRETASQAERTVLILGSSAGQGLGPVDGMMARRTLPGVSDRQQAVALIADTLQDCLLIYRGHPTDQELGIDFELPPNIMRGQDASLNDYLAIADHVLVIGGSAVAYECMVMEKPVMVIGRNMLAWFGGCAQSDGEDLSTTLDAFLQTNWSTYAHAADRLISFLLDHYLITLDADLDIGNRLEDLVDFIDSYRSRNVRPDQQRSEELLNWIRDLVALPG